MSVISESFPISVLLNFTTNGYWLGLTRYNDNPTFAWIDGSNFYNKSYWLNGTVSGSECVGNTGNYTSSTWVNKKCYFDTSNYGRKPVCQIRLSMW